MRQATTQWAPPTAFQPGMIGPHRSRGRIIENCKIHDSKCCGVSLGKRLDKSNNLWSKNAQKDGTQNYIDIVFQNLNCGFNGENNLFLSTKNFYNVSQGTALVHNIFAGQIHLLPDRVRYTFCHVPHSVKAQGMVKVFGGDDRYINNIFIGKGPDTFSRIKNGSRKGEISYAANGYDGYKSWSDKESQRTDDTLATLKKPIPVIIKNNAYFNNTQPYNKEENPYVNKKFRAKINVTEEDGHYYLNTNLGNILDSLPLGDIVTTDVLGKAFEPNQKFENRDSSPIKVDSDLMNEPRKDKVKAGAFEKIESKTKII